MALVGTLGLMIDQIGFSVEPLVWDYFRAALSTDSAIHHRIMSRPLGAFERVELGNGIFALEQHFITKDRRDCFFESHRCYIDFQLIIDGCEMMEFVPSNRLTPSAPFDHDRDFQCYGMTDRSSRFELHPGDLAIFFPHDAHMGQPMVSEPERVYKTVIKCPVELWGKS